MELSVDVYRFSDALPNDERFGLTAQMRRSASSVPANIAEGFGRQTPASFVHFLRLARGSLLETETHIELAWRLGYVGQERAEPLLAKSDRVGRMLRGLAGSLTKNQAQRTKHPHG